MQSLPHPGRTGVVHFSSGHRSDDSRIFWKECLSLARAGYDVSLVVAEDRATRREEHGVEIIGVRRRSGRFGRMMMSTISVAAAGLRRGGTVYHFHDPELIPAGFALRLLGKRVIYDAHEDLPRDILFKDWIPRGLRGPASRLAAALEWIAGRTLSGVVAATPTIARRFPDGRTALVQNFARPCEFALGEELPRGDRRTVAYIGGVTLERCAVEMVEAIAKVERFPDVRLIIAGPMDHPALEERLAASKGWPRVDYLEIKSRAGVRRLLREASVGLAVFHPGSILYRIAAGEDLRIHGGRPAGHRRRLSRVPQDRREDRVRLLRATARSGGDRYGNRMGLRAPGGGGGDGAARPAPLSSTHSIGKARPRRSCAFTTAS